MKIRQIWSLWGVTLLIALSTLALSSCSSDSKDTPPPVVPTAELKGIELVSAPHKTDYTLNEELVLDGLKVVAVYEDGSKKPIEVSASQITGFSTKEAQTNLKVTVSYKTYTTSFTVNVLPLVVENGKLVKSLFTGEELVLPKTITVLGKGVFSQSKLKKVTLPEGLQKIEEEAFIFSELETISFPNELKEIQQYAFYGCKALAHAELGNTQVKELGEGAFGFSGITKLSLPQPLKKIGAQAFMATNLLQQVTLPEGVERIGVEAFRESGIKQLELPNTLGAMDQRSFYLCSQLQKVTTYGADPKEVSDENKMDHSAFERCPNLEVFEIPKSIVSIGQSILGGNDKVKVLTIPVHVKYITFSAFGYCGVQEVYVKPTTPPQATRAEVAWYGFPEKVSFIEVPAGCKEVYQQAHGWEEFTKKIRTSTDK